jgi:hypothetical protein
MLVSTLLMGGLALILLAIGCYRGVCPGGPYVSLPIVAGLLAKWAFGSVVPAA